MILWHRLARAGGVWVQGGCRVGACRVRGRGPGVSLETYSLFLYRVEGVDI